MTIVTNRKMLVAGLVAGLVACGQQQGGDGSPIQQPGAARSNAAPVQAGNPDLDFPTLNRVEYVMGCMQEQGGQNYDTMYHCVCAVDQIDQRMTYTEYDQAQTFTQLYGMGGERGAVFRDPPESARLRDLLKQAKAAAAKVCFPEKPAARKEVPAKPPIKNR
jgi:hypothetical protein